ncbi:CTTNBP2NL [Cordylochernes scorpioides]|uniref:CTTNBP2NL n=1 Tax=Cordylochernes scorpioides TaxID=51811 RepID=A0ABY6K6E9_9ARAC|nr:CTTNBP2NL [Cordylochernes scorpioides]
MTTSSNTRPHSILSKNPEYILLASQLDPERVVQQASQSDPDRVVQLVNQLYPDRVVQLASQSDPDRVVQLASQSDPDKSDHDRVVQLASQSDPNRVVQLASQSDPDKLAIHSGPDRVVQLASQSDPDREVQLPSQSDPDKLPCDVWAGSMAARTPNKPQQPGSTVTFESSGGIDKLASSTLKRHPKTEMSRADLLHLLSVLEGELQAREIVIAVLKTGSTTRLQANLALKEMAASDMRNRRLVQRLLTREACAVLADSKIDKNVFQAIIKNFSSKRLSAFQIKTELNEVHRN